MTIVGTFDSVIAFSHHPRNPRDRNICLYLYIHDGVASLEVEADVTGTHCRGQGTTELQVPAP